MKKSILLFAATLFAAATFAQTPTVSASSVTFKYCETTDTALTIIALKPYNWVTPHKTIKITEYGTQVYTIENVRGCDSIVVFSLVSPVLPGKFSISSTQQVQFSLGNLQYKASENGLEGDIKHNTSGGLKNGIWRFAEHQWDICTATENNSKSATSTKWIDCYTWGASGSGTYNQPYQSTNSSSTSIQKSDSDWPWYNEISNGGTYHSFYTLKWHELNYILSSRENANLLRGKGQVNGVSGVILLPDDWQSAPSGCSWDNNATNYTTNVYKSKANQNDWDKMEAAGAVFFPLLNTTSSISNMGSFYWTSEGNQSPYYWKPSTIPTVSSGNRESYEYGDNNRGYVRPVKLVQ